MTEKILCLDFDGVIHSYTSGWVSATFIPDPPVPNAIQFIYEATDSFDIQIFSSRSGQPSGIQAMYEYLCYWTEKTFKEIHPDNSMIVNQKTHKIRHYFGKQSWGVWVHFPTYKPQAHVTIDDRALTFNGTFPSIEMIKAFKPWNK